MIATVRQLSQSPAGAGDGDTRSVEGKSRLCQGYMIFSLEY